MKAKKRYNLAWGLALVYRDGYERGYRDGLKFALKQLKKRGKEA